MPRATRFLKAYRVRHGISQKDLAEYMQIVGGAPRLGEYENGYRVLPEGFAARYRASVNLLTEKANRETVRSLKENR